MSTESVWDYPRPPRLESFSGHLRIVHTGLVLADTNQAYRVLETSHPPTYYIPQTDIQMDYFQQNPKRTFCEWKGAGAYLDLHLNGKVIKEIGWYYPNPSKAFAPIENYIAFYASKLDQCFVNDELVQAQPGDFYGGWITSNIKGPFKGGAGTWGW